MKKNGFTLVELLAVIVILGIISTIATFSVTSILSSSKENMLDDKIMNIESAAVNYVQTNNISLDDSCTINGNSYKFCKTFKVQELLNFKVLESHDKNNEFINDVTGKSMANDKVIVYQNAGKVRAKVTCLESNGESCS